MDKFSPYDRGFTSAMIKTIVRECKGNKNQTSKAINLPSINHASSKPKTEEKQLNEQGKNKYPPVQQRLNQSLDRVQDNNQEIKAHTSVIRADMQGLLWYNMTKLRSQSVNQKQTPSQHQKSAQSNYDDPLMQRSSKTQIQSQTTQINKRIYVQLPREGRGQLSNINHVDNIMVNLRRDWLKIQNQILTLQSKQVVVKK